eukprot:13910215-Alexandrium_andersonii.AAC.1
MSPTSLSLCISLALFLLPFVWLQVPHTCVKAVGAMFVAHPTPPQAIITFGKASCSIARICVCLFLCVVLATLARRT